MSESDLFDPYDRLVTIEVLGRRVEVPEKNRLLRCFQFLSLESISYGDFCWNGDCTNCQIRLRDPGQALTAALADGEVDLTVVSRPRPRA